MLLPYIKAFICGGLICVIAQILIDKTKLTPARILVGYVITGAFLSACGVYDYIADFAGAGATVPLLGFGHSLITGVEKAVDEQGWLGVLSGGLTGTAAGIAAVMFFSVIAAAVAKSTRRNDGMAKKKYR